MKITKNAFTADFETTTQVDDCRVWAWGLCDIYHPEKYLWGTTISEFFDTLYSFKDSIKVFFHNLAFDGDFILNFLFSKGYKWVKGRDEQEDGCFTTLISDKGVFYIIDLKVKIGKKDIHIAFYDSLKIIPFTVAKIAKDFKLPISKLEIDYKKYRPIGYKLDKNEQEYVKNDVLIMALALQSFFKKGMQQITQGSNALHDFKDRIGKKQFDRLFPYSRIRHIC